MSESIGEMILPGTYIDVRAEGLIGVGGISTGNIGVVGTANRGKVDEVVILGSYSEALDTFGQYDKWQVPAGATPPPPPLSLTRTLEQVFKGGGSTVYAVRIANGIPVARVMTVRDGANPPVDLFTLTAKSPGTWANSIKLPPPSGAATTPLKLELEYAGNKEVFEGATAETLRDAIVSTGSQWVTVSDLITPSTGTNKDKVPTTIVETTPGSNDGAAATTTELAVGLAKLATQPVNIVVAGGFAVGSTSSTNDPTSSMLAHLEATENDGLERIAVLGVSADGTVANPIDNKRVILVAPGIKATDAASRRQVDLPGPYAAALVAGRLATLAPHISLTNKDLAADGLTTDYTRAEQKNLLQNRVMVLHKNFGTRVLKGISTDSGAFKQVSVRRTVDFAKAGVRQGSNPYIGKLNNARVRAALKATLDGFLAGMVVDEMLTEYTLEVSATRAQEINGIALVTMTLKPTFSIDFVKVIMNLE
ncbi:hypothetical protein SAMN05660964_01431 [Thiothrix caldifontis]|uniref:Phage tail sheath protein n=1 Tax=Thiothrix caldifontis TaxID=525918 RepID=A0A1H4AMR6_9GAMM|nr:phage tail sheath subtilisin-like domain-containing protein [Thiothrix caldifontis]SEA37246.1 hypothetical protein SAMN05660964_01431 [Thiothrix caldifontis]